MLKYSNQIILRTPVNPLSNVSKVLVNPTLEESIYLSSIDFWNQLKRKNPSNDAHNLFGLDLTYEKYKVRSCMRSTPFASFAGCCTVPIVSGETDLVIEEADQHKRALRLDMNYLHEIIGVIEKDENIKKQLRLKTNSSLYFTKDHIRFAEYQIINGMRKYDLNSIEKTEILNLLINQIEKSNISYLDIVQSVIQWVNVSNKVAMEFIDSLLSSQILTTELEPSITINDPLLELINNTPS